MNKTLGLFLLVASALAAQDKLIGGPYVVNTTPTSATVMWVMQRGTVTAGTQPGAADKTEPVLHAEHINLTSLRPDTAYYYDVLGGREEGKGSFRTPPTAQTSATFDFLVYGDNRTRHDVHKRVVAAIAKAVPSPAFVVQTGDMVENGADTALWPVFFDIERNLLKNTSFFPSLGNHERDDRNFFDFFNVASAGYYSFNWGKCHFAVIDSDIGNVSSNAAGRQAFWEMQTRWLEEDLKASQNADFRFVVAHHPPMTAVRSRQGANPQMIELTPLLEKYHVTAGLFGHDHNYQHYLKNGVHYFVDGGGGAPLYDVDLPPAGITQKVKSIEGFMVFHVAGKSIKVDAIDINGEVIDATELK